MIEDHLLWLIERIQYLRRCPNRETTRKDIWQGSYDVIFCEEDRARYDKIMTDQMEAAQKAGYIAKYEVWYVTPKGREYQEALKRPAN